MGLIVFKKRYDPVGKLDVILEKAVEKYNGPYTYYAVDYYGQVKRKTFFSGIPFLQAYKRLNMKKFHMFLAYIAEYNEIDISISEDFIMPFYLRSIYPIDKNNMEYDSVLVVNIPKKYNFSGRQDSVVGLKILLTNIKKRFPYLGDLMKFLRDGGNITTGDIFNTAILCREYSELIYNENAFHKIGSIYLSNRLQIYDDKDASLYKKHDELFAKFKLLDLMKNDFFSVQKANMGNVFIIEKVFLKEKKIKLLSALGSSTIVLSYTNFLQNYNLNKIKKLKEHKN